MNFFKSLFAPYKKKFFALAEDAFSDGQIKSKVWLCGELENALIKHKDLGKKPLNIWVLAGWHGLLPFLLFSRQRISIKKITLFDSDENAVQSSLKVNDSWRYSGHFSAFTQDVNVDLKSPDDSKPDIVINTSCEHFSAQSWWSLVSPGTLVALQSTDMVHAEHVNATKSADDLQTKFGPWSEIFFRGEMFFDYNGFSFTRHMVIGTKAQIIST